MKTLPTTAKNFPKIAAKPPLPPAARCPTRKAEPAPNTPPTDHKTSETKLDSHQQKINAQDASQDAKLRKPQELTTP